MINNDEPSLITRLNAEALKMTRSSLHMIRSYTKHYAYFLLAGITVFVAGSFYLADMASSQEEKPVADDAVQRYTACTLSKDLVGETSPIEELMSIDDECLQLSNSGKIVEDTQDVFATELATMLQGHPMAIMADAIAVHDRTVAGLIVGIARQESQWGVHAPSKNGIDCYNYWGYKTSGTRGQSMGYACFGTPEEAVEVVAKRLDHFVHNTNRDTPAKMVTPWKCGNSCATHSPESVARWVGTVSQYFNQVVALEQNGSSQNRILSLK
jgi:hypothetical protein